MRSLALLACLCLASTVQAQSIFTPGYSGAVGPWQPSRVSPSYWNYYNSSAPVYPVAAPYGGYGYRTYLQEESLYQLRAIRREVEFDNRRWRR